MKFRGSMAGLQTPLSTVRPASRDAQRMTWGQYGLLFLHRTKLSHLLLLFGARFVRQDQQPMIEQAEGLRLNPGLRLIDYADKPAKWYFALKQARLNGMGEHPLSGPVTLHWRS
jgi:hypothetical protein